MIAIIIRFYSGGISFKEAENLPLSKLDRYLKTASEINEEEKKAIKNGV